jgi:MarR family transcriptional regulator, organic hydroperoxide resistance regulator
MRDAELLRYLVLAAQREGNRRLSRDLQSLDLSPAQSEVIRILGDCAPLTLSGLGEMLVCDSGSNPSRLVDRLVGAGLVERLTSAVDRREVTLSLTAAGMAAERRIRVVEEAFYSDLDETLGGVNLAPAIDLLSRLSASTSAGAALRHRLDAVAKTKGRS